MNKTLSKVSISKIMYIYIVFIQTQDSNENMHNSNQ